MFLIRSFFWVSLVILLLPVGEKNSANVLGATKYAFSDMGQFCSRNVDICNISHEAWQSLKYKTSYGFNVIVAAAKDIKANSSKDYKPEFGAKADAWRTGSLSQQEMQKGEKGKTIVNSAAKSSRNSVRAQKISQNTLKTSDMEASWSLDPAASL